MKILTTFYATPRGRLLKVIYVFSMISALILFQILNVHHMVQVLIGSILPLL